MRFWFDRVDCNYEICRCRTILHIRSFVGSFEVTQHRSLLVRQFDEIFIIVVQIPLY